mgnify:FL=1
MNRWQHIMAVALIIISLLVGCQPPTVVEVQDCDVIRLQLGDPLPILPKELSVTFANGQQGMLPVTWDLIEGHEGSAPVWEDMTVKGYIKSGLRQYTVTQSIEVIQPKPKPDDTPAPYTLDENNLHKKLPMTGEVNFRWSGLEIDSKLREELQIRFFKARYITHVFVFGDLFFVDPQGTAITKDGYIYYPVSNVAHFETYDRFAQFIRRTYTPDMASLFLQDKKHMFVEGQLYAVDFGWGTTTVDTGVYEAKVIEVDERKIVIELTIERLTGEPETYYNDVSGLEFQLVDGEWLIAKQEFEVG